MNAVWIGHSVFYEGLNPVSDDVFKEKFYMEK